VVACDIVAEILPFEELYRPKANAKGYLCHRPGYLGVTIHRAHSDPIRTFVTVSFQEIKAGVVFYKAFFIRAFGTTTPRMTGSRCSTIENRHCLKNSCAVRLTSDVRTCIPFAVASSWR
jgi:hypothetical protein